MARSYTINTARISDRFTKDGKFYDTIEVRNENGDILGTETIIRTWDLWQYELVATILAGGYAPPGGRIPYTRNKPKIPH